jgi:hypothetical protein
MNFLAYAIQNYTYSGHDIMLYRSSKFYFYCKARSEGVLTVNAHLFTSRMHLWNTIYTDLMFLIFLTVFILLAITCELKSHSVFFIVLRL